ncbi:MAG: RidA family protein [Acidimicrobiales bacterium]
MQASTIDLGTWAGGNQGRGRLLICPTQASIDPWGQVLHEGDVEAQLNWALRGVRSLLGRAGYSLDDVVVLHVRTTDVEACEAYFEQLGREPTTLIRASTLSRPGVLVEVSAVAAR